METATQERMTGVVIFVNIPKGFGVIRTPGKRDHRFRLEDLSGPAITNHSAVSFVSEPLFCGQRDRALNVRVIAAPEVKG